MRNQQMAERIARSPVAYPFSFAFAGDSGAWPDPTADAIFGGLVRQVEALRPAPVFFANLGDFAGPGTRERHAHYLELVAPLSMPNLCAIGNHDLDDVAGEAAWAAVHGARNVTFAYGHTRFVVLDAAPGEPGRLAVATTEGVAGPRDEALEFLDRTLAAAPEPHRIVLMHIPPHLDGHYAPHAEWGFNVGEAAFLTLVRRHRVTLVCCAHGLTFDHHVHDGTHYVMSGGGGTGLCSHGQGICAEGSGTPEDRGALFHFVQIVVDEHGGVRGHVHQAFATPDTPPRISFAAPAAVAAGSVSSRGWTTGCGSR